MPVHRLEKRPTPTVPASGLLKHNPKFVAFIDQLEAAQSATGLLGGVEQAAISYAEPVVVEGTLDHASLQGRQVQRVTPMRTLCLYQVALPVPLDQQQL